MANALPRLSDWPVLHRELVRAARRPWARLLRYGCAAVLFFQFVTLMPPAQGEFQGRITARFDYGPTPVEIGRAQSIFLTQFATDYLRLLLLQQLALLGLLTPAVTAGALGHEKERDTLPALFGTQLGSAEIVVSK